jgi:5-methylcytosine-specific restriction endonuclease McrA
MRECSKCHVLKPLTEFSLEAKGKDGRRAQCKSCWNETRRLKYLADVGFRERKRIYEEGRAAEVRKYKSKYMREWFQKRPRYRYAQRLIANQARRARKRNQFVEKVDPAILFDMHGGICGICESPIERKFHVDHIIPNSKGGLHCYANTQPTHPKCNLIKSDRVQ